MVDQIPCLWIHLVFTIDEAYVLLHNDTGKDNALEEKKKQLQNHPSTISFDADGIGDVAAELVDRDGTFWL